MRYFLKLAYNGEKYHGWQIQPNAVSIQQQIEEALSTVLRLPTVIVGAGRTDAGVHAREMFAHFDTPFPITEKKRIILSLNRLLGKDIAIHDIIKVSDEAHARFDAFERTYKYFISFEKTPFLYPYSWLSPSKLDIERMNEASSFLLLNEDFTSFAKLHSDSKTNLCDVRYALWERITEDTVSSSLTDPFTCLFSNGAVFTISADRFLRNMVRAIVGTLVDVGRGKLSINDFCKIIKSKNRCSAGTSMPPQGLFLWQVKYPYI